MADKSVTAAEAETQLKALLEFVQKGHDVLISDGSMVIARLVPASQKRRIAGLTRGAARTAPDFDEPLADSYWEGKS
jgi:antitoxin (DNA-binding transcriptional repressor) of toxin-antitoxin stability system